MKRHIGRHCPYTYAIWCGSVHALLRYRSKTTKMQKFPIGSHSNENFIFPFVSPLGPLTPKRGEDTSGTRVRPHANFGFNRPAGCGEIVDNKKAKKQKNRAYSKTNISPFALTNEWCVKKNKNKCVSKTDTNPPFAFQIAFPRSTDFTGFLQGGSKIRDLQSEISVRMESRIESADSCLQLQC